MRESNLEPAPRGRLEKAYDNVGYLLPMFGVMAYPLIEAVGFWPSIALFVVASATVTLIVLRLVTPLRRRRSSLDAEQGIFECGHRERGSALKGRWARGYAKAEAGRLLFQTRTGENDPLGGPLEIYSALSAVGPIVKAPWSVFPGGRVITLSTDKGIVELAATPSSLNLLAERCFSDGPQGLPQE